MATQRDSWELLMEIYARILSFAVTDEESERVVESMRKFGDRLRQYSSQNLKRLEQTNPIERPFCKHSGTCTQNCIRSFVRSFVALYAANYALAIAPALLRGHVFKRTEILWKAAGQDTRSFALWFASFISAYKGLLCLFRRFFKKDCGAIAFAAGALAGGTISLDTNQSRRTAIALYLSTRNLHFIYRWIWRMWLEKRWGIQRDPIGESDGELVKLANAMAAHTDQAIASLHQQNESSSDTATLARNGRAEIMLPRIRVGGVSQNVLDLSTNTSANGNPTNCNVNKSATSAPKPHPKFEVFEEDELASPATNPTKSDTDAIRARRNNFDVRAFLSNINAVLVMSLSSAQILYAFTAMPHTLAKSYFSFLLVHGSIRGMSKEKAPLHMAAIASAVNGSTRAVTTKWIPAPDGEGVPTTIDRFLPDGINPEPFKLFSDMLLPTVHDHDFVICSLQHPETPSCRKSAIKFFLAEYYRASQLYAPLNIITTLVFRPRAMIRTPIKTMIHFLFTTARSAFFLACFCATGWTSLCAMRRHLGKDAPWMYVVNGLMAGTTVLLEARSRRLELAMYCLPRALESFYRCGVEWGWWRYLLGGERLYFCLSTGILMLLYQHDPESIPETYRNLFTRFLGAN
ncbi:hypothetical protein SeMB42_g07554 [Synchytrium endobioticum]|uniref:Transmembrane protein 135 N-terminal domain-containing protein n=1 Tax=Synchytrium endobioticum TaxID=286115 RepID=A0A507C5X3_9FUNG|nr:hypothetical protein SeMB42_g07554 [Synchytrium endobioticum]TPX44868.1 hypothetical protein SeLEV6574_g04245 [Synchytrium endobioticum]